MIEIVAASSPSHIMEFRQLLEVYGQMRGLDKALGNFEEELKTLPGKYLVVLLAKVEDNYGGCVAIREIGEGICEMKRLFVLPKYRGLGMGRMLTKGILESASKLGFLHMKLDTHPSMKTAQALYESMGFLPTERYNDNPTPGIKFYEKPLKKPRANDALGL